MSSVWSRAFRNHGRRIRRALNRRIDSSSQQATMSALFHGEVLDDVTTVSRMLRDALPILVREGMRDGTWPDTMLADVIHDVAEAVGRLDAAANLLRAPDR